MPPALRKGIGLGLALLTALTTGSPGHAQTPDPCAAPANPIVAENCLPGTDEWLIDRPPAANPAIEGFAYPPSIDRGETVTFYVNTPAPRFDIHIYRSGYYGGLGGRLILSITDLPGQSQPACHYDCQTGLASCANWSPSHRLTVPVEWVSGVYLARLALPDGAASYALFTVRDDARPSDILFQQSLFTYQAYNNQVGKALYTAGGGECNTIAGSPRAVSVSFHRPYDPALDLYRSFSNSYFRAEFAMARWLEAQGYDVTYATDLDTHRSGLPGAANRLLHHRAFLMAGHDEYWTQEMRDAITAARDAGVHIGNFSAQTGLWRARLTPDPWTGEPDSVLVSYKTVESGPPDPSGHSTSSFRDPEGPDDPENGLLGIMHIGENDSLHAPLRVTAEHGQDRIYRHTDLQALPPGTYAIVGQDVVGWEFDTVFDNGHTPEELEILAATPVFGVLLQDAGDYKASATGETTTTLTRYTAPSGAIVLSAGTNQWSWGLGARQVEAIAPDPLIEQITYNILADMGIQPATPGDGLILDGEDGSLPVDPDAIFPLDAPNDIVIENVQVHHPAGDLLNDGRTVTIAWETNVPTAGQLWFGRTPELINVERGHVRAFAHDHALTEINLIPGEIIYYQILAVDERGRLAVYDGHFQTPPNLLVQGGSAILNALRAGRCWSQANPTLATAGGLALALVITLAAGRALASLRRRLKRGR